MTSPTDFTSNSQAPQTPGTAFGGGSPHAHTSESANGPQQAPALTNAAFIKGIFNAVPGNHCLAVAHFKDFNKPNWKAEYWTAAGCPDYSEENAYFCPSSLQGESRKLEAFAALHVVVLDDITLEATAQLQAPTYAIETSAGNYQVGYKLDEPLTDKALAQEIHNGLHSAGYCDSNGNNPVRWIRLPVGMNTKDGKGMFRHKVAAWNPERTFNVEQLRSLLRLGQAKAPTPTPTPSAQDLSQTVFVPVQHNEYLDPQKVTELRSALNAIPPDEYDNWSLMGLALKPYGNVGMELWLTWSMRSEKYNPREAQHKWNTAFNNTDSTCGAVFALADKYGWVNPKSNAARDPDAPAAPIPEGLEGLAAEVEKQFAGFQAEDKADRAAMGAGIGAGTGGAEYTTTTAIADASLPPFCKSLINLPYGLGVIQDYFYGIMPFPERALAGFSALSMFGCVAMANKTIDSRHGLSFNQYNLALIETGGGKEEMRRGIFNVHKALAWNSGVAQIQYSLPASMQGLHDQLVEDNVQMYVADEYAEWLVGTKNDSHKQGALAHLMQIYSSATSTVAPPRASGKDRPPVSDPRVGVFGTSTAARLLEVMTSSQGNAGAYNRTNFFVGSQEPIPEKFSGFKYAPSEECLNVFRFLREPHDDHMVRFNSGGLKVRQDYANSVTNPIRRNDPMFGARLAEEAIKFAGMVALSDGRHIITRSDMETGFEIRMCLYNRFQAALNAFGGMGGKHETVEALDQLRAYFVKHADCYISQLEKASRAYKKLDVAKRHFVQMALLDEKSVERNKKGNKFVSQMWE